jgi:hypothetical protein
MHARELAGSAKDLKARSRRASGLAILIDGLDEAGEGLMDSVGNQLSRLAATGVTIFFAARTDFFERTADLLQRTLGEPREVLEIRSWTRDDIIDFATRYTERIDDNSVLLRLRQILDSVPGALDLSSNPMRLTLLLYLLATDAAVDVHRLTNTYALYDMFYREWLAKERRRGTGGSDPQLILQAHTRLARWIYTHRSERVQPHEVIGPEVWTASS